MKQTKYLLVAGARPNFMKVAPIHRAFSSRRNEHSNADLLLVHTGQHYSRNMSDDFFRDLGIPEPDINLEVGSGSHAEQTARIMMAFEPGLPGTSSGLDDCRRRRELDGRLRPDREKIGHSRRSRRSWLALARYVHAGGDQPPLYGRRFRPSVHDRHDRGPESAENSVAGEKIHFVGNTMIHTLWQQIGRARQLPLPDGLAPGEYAVLTLHRPANVDSPDRLALILAAINAIAERIPVVFPVHPRTASRFKELELHPRIRIVEPISYLPFLGLVARSRMLLTDSGGIQEKTTVLGVPCLTMRPNTERPITCEIGTNVLVGTDPRRIVREAGWILDGNARSGAIPEKWDGHAAERIVDLLLDQPVQASCLVCA